MSTATPAINAWLNPCHRAIVSAQNLVGKLERRVNLVMACLMTEALEISQLHAIPRVRVTSDDSLLCAREYVQWDCCVF